MTHPRPQVASLGTAYATYRASLAGEAFQLHDDLLGVSGDPRPTGTGQQ